MKFTWTIIAGLALLYSGNASAQAAAGDCPIHPVPLTAGVSIILSDGDILSGGAMVWDQPMRLRHADGTSCTVDARVSIITGPLFDAGGRVLMSRPIPVTIQGGLPFQRAIAAYCGRAGFLPKGPFCAGSVVCARTLPQFASRKTVCRGKCCICQAPRSNVGKLHKRRRSRVVPARQRGD